MLAIFDCAACSSTPGCSPRKDSPAGVEAARTAGTEVLHYGRDFTDTRDLPRVLGRSSLS